jgi:N6-adenosine-specific RNA methylase IME4
MTENSVTLFTNANKMLAEATTIQKAKELMDIALTAADWAKRKKLGEEAIQYARSYAFEAERRIGELLKATERSKGGEQYHKIPTGTKGEPVPTLSDLGLTKKQSSDAQFLAGLPETDFKAIAAGEKTIKEALREAKREEQKEYFKELEAYDRPFDGKYDVVIIDPPWPMQKIDREVAPEQTGFDYPTMTEEEISAMKMPMADDCHVFMWTTQKFLPAALRIIDVWGLKYTCCFTWCKNGGFQVYNLPQYNSEFVIYARKGSPKFRDTKDFFTCFSADRTGHSEKPDKFYDTVKRVTAGKRIDIFGRRDISGFDSWGNESGD